MEFFLIFILLILVIYNFFAIKSLKQKVRILEIELKNYYYQFHELSHPKIQTTSKIKKEDIPVTKSEVKPSDTIEAPKIEIVSEPLSEPNPEKSNIEIPVEITDSAKSNLYVEERIKQQTQKIIDKIEGPKHQTIQEFESLIGGRILNRIGSAALIIGIALFLKYAFDNNLISETLRIVIGFVTGFGLIALGERYIKKDFKIFAQGIFGTGLATLYLTVFAAYNFYHLFSQPVAFGVMTLVTAICYFIARRHNSKSISWIASIGGYLTPILLQSGNTNVLALLAFLTILNINQILQIKYKPEWQQLIYLSFIVSYFYFFSLVSGITSNELNYIHGLIFIFVNFAIFTYYELQSKSITNTILSIANLVLINLGLLLIISNRIHILSDSIIWLYLAALMVVNISQILFIKKKSNWQNGFIISLLFSWVHFWILISKNIDVISQNKFNPHFEIYFLFIIWAYFFFCEFFLNNKYYDDIKQYIQTLSILNITFVFFSINTTFNNDLTYWKPLALLILCIIYFLPYFIKSVKEKIANETKMVYLISSFILLLSATYFEFDKYYVPMLWTLEIIAISMILYRNKNFNELSIFKFTIFLPLFYTVVFVYFPELGSEKWIYTPFLNPKFIVFGLLTVCLFISLRLPEPDKNIKSFFSNFQSELNNIIEILWVVFFTITFLNEINEIHINIQKGATNWWIFDLFHFIRAAFLLLVAYMLFLKNLFFNKSIKLGNIIALSSISSLYTILFLIAEVHLFQPFLNLRIAFFIFSLGIIIHQIVLSEKEFSKNISTYFRILLTCLAFSFVTSEVRFYFTNIGVYSQILQNQKELATSIAWIFLSLIFLVIGIWKRIRVYRFISIILFGISILKVFIFDLSFLETIYRIISFIVLGVILIFISFLYQKYKDIIFMEEK
jgi:uncharacterized membrane protein